MILDRTLVLTNTASDTEIGLQIGPCQLDFFSPALDDFNLPGENGLWGGGTDFLANHAGDIHSPGQASAPIVERYACFNRAWFGEFSYTKLLSNRNFLNGSCRADLTAESAVEFTVAHPHVHNRCPDPFDSSFEHGRLQHVGGTDPNALIAFDTAFQKFRLSDRSWGAYNLFLEVFGEIATTSGKGK